MILFWLQLRIQLSVTRQKTTTATQPKTILIAQESSKKNQKNVNFCVENIIQNFSKNHNNTRNYRRLVINRLSSLPHVNHCFLCVNNSPRVSLISSPTTNRASAARRPWRNRRETGWIALVSLSHCCKDCVHVECCVLHEVRGKSTENDAQESSQVHCSCWSELSFYDTAIVLWLRRVPLGRAREYVVVDQHLVPTHGNDASLGSYVDD